MAIVKEKFKKWLIVNKVCDKNKNIILNKDVYSIDKCLELLEQISEKMINNNEIDKDIFDIKNYQEAKKIATLFFHSKNTKYVKGIKMRDLCIELFNYFLKFEFTTFEKKYDIHKSIMLFNCENVDISNVYMHSRGIYKGLCKWPYIYTITDKDNKYITKVFENNYRMLCIPVYTSKEYVNSTYKNNNYKIKKEKFNLFLKKLDEDDENHAAAIVLDPEFKNDKVFLCDEEWFWYYYPDMSNYWD